MLNRGELIGDATGVEYWTAFRLEPEFLAVVLAALVHSGDVILSLPGRKLDAAGIDQLAKIGIAELTAFKHVERPRDVPVAPLQELLTVLDLPPGLIVDPARRDEAVTQLQGRVAAALERTVVAQARLGELVLWGRPVLSDAEQQAWGQQLAALKTFLESLQVYNTAGKLKNFQYEEAEVASHRNGLATLTQVESLSNLLQQVATPTAYLGRAEAVLGVDHPWAEGLREARSALFAAVADPSQRTAPGLGRKLSQDLAALRDSYRHAYLASHQRARLGVNEDRRKAAILNGDRLSQARRLSGVDILPAQRLRDLEERLHGLRTCFGLTEADLQSDPVCPHCGYRPVEEPMAVPAAQVLDLLDDQLDETVAQWTTILLDNLADPAVAEDIELLADSPGKVALVAFVADRTLPEDVPPEFIAALREVLGGLEKVVLRREALEQALLEGGVPCTVDELETRFHRHLQDLTRGMDRDKARVVLE